MNDLFNTLLLYRKKNFGQGNIFITKNNWLVGSHDELTNLNSKIYSGNTNLDQLIKNNVRIGRRDHSSDELKNLPDEAAKRQAVRSYRKNVESRAVGDVSENSLIQKFAGQRTKDNSGNFSTRLSDEYKIVWEYYHHKTPESHHIVEDDIVQNILRFLKSKFPKHVQEWQYLTSVFKRGNAPCVLITSEFHRRYINKFIVPTRNNAKDYFGTSIPNSQVDKNKLYLELDIIKNDFLRLYSGYRLEDLQKISLSINDFLISKIRKVLK